MRLFKRQSIEKNNINDSIVIQAANLDKDLFAEIQTLNSNKKLLNKLVLENIIKCKSMIVDKNLDEANKIIDTIFIYGLISIDKSICNQLYSLKAVINIFSRHYDIVQDCIDNIDDLSIKHNIQEIKSLEMSPDKFDSFESFSQDDFLHFLALDILFSKGQYQKIADKFSPKSTSDDIGYYYYGLSNFNVGNNEKAIEAFSNAKTIKNKIKYQFHFLIAQTSLHIEKFTRTYRLSNDLEICYKNLYQLYNDNQTELHKFELIYITVTLNAQLIINKEDFFSSYDILTDALKKRPSIRVLLAQYRELVEDYGKALEIYKELINESSNEEIYFRFLSCSMMLKHYEEVINEFSKIDDALKSPRIIGTYLSAVNILTPLKYIDLFNVYFNISCLNIDMLFHLALSTNDNLEAQRKIYDVIKTFDVTSFKENIHRIVFAHLSYKNNNISLCKNIFYSIYALNELELEQAYIFLSRIDNCDLREEFADWFIENSIKTATILGVKIDSLMKKEKYIKALLLSKELFEINPTEKCAMDIVQLINRRDSVSYDDYNPYLDFLSENKDPIVFLIRAMAYFKLGNLSMSDSLSYKAIYLLENKDDFQVFDLYMSLQFHQIKHNPNNTVDYDKVIENSVAYLKCIDNDDILSYCLNQESEYQNDISSIGTSHISKSNILYLKLLNRNQEDQIEYQNRKYVIKSIINKYAHTFRYVLQKITQSTTHRSPVILKTITTTGDPDDIKKQIFETLQQDNSHQELLDLYHFRNNGIGLPIESLRRGNYDRYIDIVRFLLFGEEQVLYAGQNHIEVDKDSKVSLSLSALVVLDCIDKLSLLDKLGKIIVPRSLLSFVQNRSEDASRNNVNSPGTLAAIEGKPVIFPTDKNLPDFWNKIYEVISKYAIYEVTDRERTDNKLFGLDLEEYFSKTNIHNCQLDSLILSKRENAVYLSDDLFFRKLSRAMGIPTINSSILFTSENEDDVISLAESNYIYLPMIQYSKNMLTRLTELTMKNERKKTLYLQRYLGVFVAD